MLTSAEHPDVQEIRAPQTPALDPTKTSETVADTVAATASSLPLFTFPTPQSQPEYAPVDINELSAGLGLPALKTDAADDASTATSHKSRLSQAHPGALYGKLIGWALEKPLTARGLAEYLHSQDTWTPVEPSAPTSVSPTNAYVHRDIEAARPKPREEQPPEEHAPAALRIPVSAPTEDISVPKGPSAHQHQHRRSSASSASFRHHTRMPSNRRYPRRTSRAKRIDQGPMPSAADIYPDDANWTPSAPIYEGLDYVSHHQPPIVEQPRIVVENVFDWPPPAQVYAPEPAPTTADICAADHDVLALMNELPEPTLCTLAALGNSHDLRKTTAFELPCDERALTPAQIDGSRYGIRFHGLAYGDQWELPKVGDFGESEAFRVRPRDHDGWGGLEWALKQGWEA